MAVNLVLPTSFACWPGAIDTMCSDKVVVAIEHPPSPAIGSSSIALTATGARLKKKPEKRITKNKDIDNNLYLDWHNLKSFLSFKNTYDPYSCFKLYHKHF